MSGFSITNFNLICHQSMYPDLAKHKLTRMVRFSIKLDDPREFNLIGLLRWC